jgi:hypothetical protein
MTNSHLLSETSSAASFGPALTGAWDDVGRFIETINLFDVG